MTKRPLILITNDDGIDSPGLHAAAAAVADLGDLLIMAPNSQRTGAGRGFPPVRDKAIYLTEIPLGSGSQPAYTADVSPAQAVQLAMLELAERPIDLCISGINYGENLGSGVTISGTIGAALEAACSGIPAVALSLETPPEFHLNNSPEVEFSVAAHFTRQFARQILDKGLPRGADLLKIDIPAGATVQTGWRAARISRQRYYQTLPSERTRLDEPRELRYRIYIDHESLEPGSDIHTVMVDKLIAVVPMTFDLTALVELNEVKRFFEERGGEE
jgi:5'-nucleotidase